MRIPLPIPSARVATVLAATFIVGLSTRCTPTDSGREPAARAATALPRTAFPRVAVFDATAPAENVAPAMAPPVPDASAELLKTATLKGPFRRIDDYCRAGPQEPGRAVRCNLQPDAYGRRLGSGSGALFEAQLFSFRADQAGVMVSYCRVAVRTSAGWFVEAPDFDMACQGVDGPGSAAKTRTEALRFSDDGQTVIVIVRRTSTRDPPARSVVLCGVGPSAVPSCTETVSIGCATNDESNRFVELAWRYRSGELVIDAASDAGENGCRGTGDRTEHYRVAFP